MLLIVWKIKQVTHSSRIPNDFQFGIRYFYKEKQTGMKILKEKITIDQLREMANQMFGNMVKAVVDVRQKIIALDAELHADEEAMLLQNGSLQQDLWGINLYPDMERNGPDFIEFDSMINLRPSQNNRSRGVENKETRDLIIAIVGEWIV